MRVLYFLHYRNFPFQQQLNVRCISSWHTFSEEDNINILFRVSPKTAVGLTPLNCQLSGMDIISSSIFLGILFIDRGGSSGVSIKEFGYNLAFSRELGQLNQGQKAGLKTTTERCCSLAQT